MKTIEERAREDYGAYLVVDSENGIPLANKEKCFMDGYKIGAAEQKAIMLEEASKGFDEWFKNNIFERAHGLQKEASGKAWQAATLSKMKEIEEMKKNVRGAIKYMEAHDYQQYDPCEPEYQMYASLKNALSTVESR